MILRHVHVLQFQFSALMLDLCKFHNFLYWICLCLLFPSQNLSEIHLYIHYRMIVGILSHVHHLLLHDIHPKIINNFIIKKIFILILPFQHFDLFSDIPYQISQVFRHPFYLFIIQKLRDK